MQWLIFDCASFKNYYTVVLSTCWHILQTCKCLFLNKTHMHTCTHTGTHAQSLTHTVTHTRTNTHIHTHTLTHTHTHTEGECQQQKHTQNSLSTKIEYDYLYGCIKKNNNKKQKNGLIHKNLSNSGEPLRCSWKCRRRRRNTCTNTCIQSCTYTNTYTLMKTHAHRYICPYINYELWNGACWLITYITCACRVLTILRSVWKQTNYMNSWNWKIQTREQGQLWQW